MRYYFLNDEEKIIGHMSADHSSIGPEQKIKIELVCQDEAKSFAIRKRRLGPKTFISIDGGGWRNVPSFGEGIKSFEMNFNWASEVFQFYQGFLPSGLSQGHANELITQMPGKVVKISVKVGDEIKKGQTVLVLEAMKMENEIKSAIDGKIAAIHVEEGQTLDSGILMIELES